MAKDTGLLRYAYADLFRLKSREEREIPPGGSFHAAKKPASQENGRTVLAQTVPPNRRCNQEASSSQDYFSWLPVYTPKNMAQ